MEVWVDCHSTQHAAQVNKFKVEHARTVASGLALLHGTNTDQINFYTYSKIAFIHPTTVPGPLSVTTVSLRQQYNLTIAVVSLSCKAQGAEILIGRSY